MAYKTEELEKKSLEAIDKHKLFFIEDVVAFLPCDKTTFYNHKLTLRLDNSHIANVSRLSTHKLVFNLSLWRTRTTLRCRCI